jgi:hypothetical protein
MGLPFIVVLAVLLSAGYPVREGTEVMAVGGGGEYESEQSSSGCENGKWIIRTRHADGGLAVRHRFAHSPFYVSAESISGVHDDVAVHEVFADEGAAPYLNTHTYAGMHGVRVGYQAAWWGAEAGPAVVLLPAGDISFPLPLPTGSLTVGRESGFFGFADVLAEPLYLTSPVNLGVGYSGDQARFKLSLAGGADFDLRLAEHLWVGAMGSYGGQGHFGPVWNAAGKLTFAFYPPPPTAGAR